MITKIKNVLCQMADGFSFSHEAEMQTRAKKTDTLHNQSSQCDSKNATPTGVVKYSGIIA